MPRALLLLVLVPLAAVAQPPPADHDGLWRSSDAERRSALQAGIASAGLPCTGVSLAAFSGTGGSPFAYWDVRCTDGNMYRATVPVRGDGPPRVLTCGAAAPAPASGPCFRPVGAVAAWTGSLPGAAAQAVPVATSAGVQTAAAGPAGLLLGLRSEREATPQEAIVRTSPIIGFEGPREAACRALCEPRDRDRVSACMGICAQGGDPDAPPLGSLPGARFGAAYATAAPHGGIGFRNGMQDRMEANVAAAAACDTMAREIPCLFQAEFVNQCGAVAQSVERHPNAALVTADISTFVVGSVSVGRGGTLGEAEQDAMRSCDAAENTAARRAAGHGGRACRITASGC